jgi:hypothetical protein
MALAAKGSVTKTLHEETHECNRFLPTQDLPLRVLHQSRNSLPFGKIHAKATYVASDILRECFINGVLKGHGFSHAVQSQKKRGFSPRGMHTFCLK